MRSHYVVFVQLVQTEQEVFMRQPKRAPPFRRRYLCCVLVVTARINFSKKGIFKMEMKKKIKRNAKRVLSYVLAFVMLCGVIPQNATVARAASSTVSLSSLGRKGTVTFGEKSKSGTWWQMNLNGKKAFCLNLGYTCHSGNTYAAETKYQWDQDTGGEKQGYYAKIIRWYVIDKKRAKKAYVLSQALIWSVQNGRNSKENLKDVIKQVKNNINVSPNKTVAELYEQIFEPSGSWTAEATLWKKTGNSKSYQTLLTVDADEEATSFNPKHMNDSTYYRQRITVMKQDEDGKGLGGIQFTLSADNLDELYSFAVTDRNGTDASTADEDDTSFSLTGQTLDSGRIAFRMTYRLQTMDYYYFSDSDLASMTSEEKKTAKKQLIDLELDEGVDFASDLSKAGAEKLMKAELKEMMDDISNSYTLTEDNTGKNLDIIADPEYKRGVKITLGRENSWQKNADGVWPDSLEKTASDYSKAYRVGVTNRYKKATIHVVKKDAYSSDKKAHGDASLEGAQFQLYAEQSCTNKATVYDSSGKAKTADVYTIKDGKLETDYLRSGTTYYLKEVTAPKGYLLSDTVLPVKVDASGKTAEYTVGLTSVEYGNQPVLGKVAVQKYASDGETGELDPEVNTTFQVYLKSKGSYDACDEYERATIKTDKTGYAVTGNLYYGTYTVHQVDSGDVDAILVDDFDVDVTEDGKTYTFSLVNEYFKAYLRILKLDGQTKKQVLKAGTAYQIYKVTDEGEQLVTQSYSNGNKKVTVDTFFTDESGEIMTVKPLRSATYRIYETDSAEGLHISEEFIEVTINSKADNYESYQDEEGNTHAVVTVTYTNEETYGKLAVSKTGEVLTGWDAENQTFEYEDRVLDGAEFTVYADGDIVTQDNQGDVWFKNGDKVATIVTGQKAEFTSDCNGICTQSVDEDGVVHITLPLGKYTVRETKTLYGYVFPEDNVWNLEFTWQNSHDEFVINSTKDTDEDGTMNVRNTFAKTSVELLKEDADSREGIGGAVFGLYASTDIYNADGEKIVDAGTELTRLTTSEDGTAQCDMKLPLMSEGYTATGAAVTAQTTLPPIEELSAIVSEKETAANQKGMAQALNSGDYYLKEISVPDSYYLDTEPVSVHMEYKDADTKTISVKCFKENRQTTNEIDKISITNAKEVTGCALSVSDDAGKEIVSWVSGMPDSVKVSAGEQDGYCNLKTTFDENGNLHIGGLLHDREYTLTETRPADGYVTAERIVYKICRNTAEDGTVSSVVAVRQKDGTFVQKEDDRTVMVDAQTKIRLIKLDGETGQGLPGAKFTVTDARGNVVMKFVSTEDGVDITGKLVAGETYTFTETSAPGGYKTADAITYTVKDTAGVQKISVTDERIPETPDVPQTGETIPVLPLAAGFAFAAGAVVWVMRRKKMSA